jgi:hypothetical protein
MGDRLDEVRHIDQSGAGGNAGRLSLGSSANEATVGLGQGLISGQGRLEFGE